MKKTVAVLILLTIVTVFFCASVYAVNYPPIYVQRRTNSTSNGGVTVTAVATQLGVTAESYFQAGGSYTPVLVSIQLYNNNSTQSLVNGVKFGLQFQSTPFMTNAECFTTDLTLGSYVDGYFNVVPSTDFSYGNGIVVPPKQSIYLYAIIYVEANFNSSTNTFSAEPLQHIPLGSITVNTSSTYPYGMPVDLSSLDSYLNDIESNQSDIVGYIDGVESAIDAIRILLNDVKTQITYTGSYSIPTKTSFSYQSYTLNTGITDFVVQIGVTRLPSYIISDEFVTGSGSNSYHTGTRVTPVQLNILFYNATGHSIGMINTIRVRDIIQYSSNVTPVVAQFVSNLFGGYSLIYGNNPADSLGLTFKMIYNNNGIVPQGRYDNAILINYYSDYSVGVDLNSNVNIMTPISAGITDALPYFSDEQTTLTAIYADLHELLEAYQTVNTSSLDSASDNLSDNVDSAHSMESQFFQQNSQAINSTGLGNYQFSSAQGNGISGVTNIFNRLWNSISGWNTVYVFSLTLTIALTIIRYTTNAIRHRSNTSGNKGGNT